MKHQLHRGLTSKTVKVFLQDSTSTTGAGLTGLTSASSGLIAYYIREGDNATTAITLSAGTLGTWSSGGFVEVDATHMPGIYELGLPNAAVASGNSVVVVIRGATNLVPRNLEIQLTDTDVNDGVRFGLTALPNAAAGATGGADCTVTLGGTASAGSATSITLTGGSATDNYYNHQVVQIVGGTGVGQARTIVSYTGSTKVAIVNRAWRTNPDNTSVFAVKGIDVTPSIGVLGGLAVAATSTTITLTSAAVATDNYYNGCLIVISAGTGLTQTRVIKSYVGSTQVATVDHAWTTTPDTTSVFLLMQTDLAAKDASLQIAANAVNGNVTGSVGSVVGGVTVTTNNDKTGYGLSTLESFILHSGTAQAATSTTIALAASASSVDSLYNGEVIKIYGGTGAGQARIITAYTGVSKAALVDRAWITTPDATSLYAILSLDQAATDANLAIAANAVNGNVTGSVGSVTGNVGGSVASVTGNVGGNVVGSVGSVTGNVGGNVSGNVTGSVGSVASGGITAASFGSGALGAVWDESISSHTTSGTFGQRLQDVRSGTAQAGAAGTITLDAGASATNSFYNNCLIYLTGGTGAGQSRFVTGYVGATKVATVNDNWVVNPDNTSVFVILPWDAVTQVIGAVGSVTGNVGGSVGSVTGNVGGSVASVTGNVGGSVNSVTSPVPVQSGTGANQINLSSGNVGVQSGTGANQISLTSGAVTVGTNNDKTGYSLLNGSVTSSTFAAGALGAVWDESLASHTTSGTFGQALQKIRTGTAQAGASTSITLDAGASATDSFYNNGLLFITSGTGQHQARFITAYVGATKVATVGSAWATNPDSTSVFEIIPFDAISIPSVPTAAQNAAAVWNEPRASHTTAGTFGEGVAAVEGNVTGSVNSVTSAVTVGTNNDKTGYGLSSLESFLLQNGTAQAGAATTITLAAGASATDNLYVGQVIKLYGGTGSGQARVITGYVGSTKVATVDRAWQTNPDNTTTYAVLAFDLAATDSSLRVTANSVSGDVAGSVNRVATAVTVGTNNDKTGYSLSGAGIAAIWNALTSGFSTVGSIGLKLANWALGSDNRALVSADTHTSGETVAAVTGAVGSVAGNVAGSVGSVTGAVGSVTAAVTVGTNNDKTGYSLATTPPTAAQVATQVLTSTNLSENAQGLPPVTPTLAELLMYFYMEWRNTATSTASLKAVENDAGSVISKASLSDDGTTFTKSKMQSGP